MKFSISLLIVSLSLVISVVTLFIRSNSLLKLKEVKSDNYKKIRYLPMLLGIATIILTLITTQYYRNRNEQKLIEFEKLTKEMEIKNSEYKKDVVANSVRAIDEYRKVDNSVQDRLLTTDTAYKNISKLKDELLKENVFVEVDSKVKDRIINTYNNIKSNKDSLQLLKTSMNNNSAHGYVYVGIFSQNRWIENNFKTISKSKGVPAIGDTLVAINTVNIRAGEIQITENNEWVNQKLIGVLKSGQSIKVKDVIEVADNYIWVKF